MNLIVLLLCFLAPGILTAGGTAPKITEESPVTIIESESLPAISNSRETQIVPSSSNVEVSSPLANDHAIVTTSSSGSMNTLPFSTFVTAATSSSREVHGGILKININTAQLETLLRAPGLDMSSAMAIIDYRTSNGNIQSLDDLMNISRLNRVNFSRFRRFITVSDLDFKIKLKVESLVEDEMVFLGVNPEEAGKLFRHFRRIKRPLNTAEIGRKYPEVLEILNPYLLP
ncbi:MAG: helix-hairpin-helix domain-containing protein [Candidatus Wallbacteria bacterium]|nr:helix-hairpin-helix domain-containing protein [Candidatus Wallbacteria bacterium]